VAGAPNPTLGGGVCHWRSNRREVHLRAVGFNDRVEGTVELGVAIAEQEAELLATSGKRHRQPDWKQSRRCAA
jgi:hypothetical protein